MKPEAESPTTRQLILASAMDIIGKSGIEALTTRRVAEQACVNLGLLHYYFRTKDALAREAKRPGVRLHIPPLAVHAFSREPLRLRRVESGRQDGLRARCALGRDEALGSRPGPGPGPDGKPIPSSHRFLSRFEQAHNTAAVSLCPSPMS